MKEITLKETIAQLIESNPNTIFLVDGDSLRGDCSKIKGFNRDKFIFVRDYMAVGTAAPEVLSPEFISLRIESLCGPFGNKLYSEKAYEQECISGLRSLAHMPAAEIVLIQYDCYVSRIWQMTMMAYIEQLGCSNCVKRILFYDGERTFGVSRMDDISVEGAHEAYCRIVCEKKMIDLSQYLISEEAVACYFDINSSDGKLRQYIRDVSSGYDKHASATGQFLYDFADWGLGDGEFIRIAYQTLSEDPRFEAVAKKWKKSMKLWY